MRFIDTNVFLRYLTGDHSKKAVACRRLIEAVDSGDEQVATSEAVIAEVVFVLRSRRHYDVPAHEVRDLLAPIIAMRGLQVDHKQVFLRALDLMATDPALDFEVALSVMHMHRKGLGEIYSYDTDFDSLPGVGRVEPA